MHAGRRDRAEDEAEALYRLVDAAYERRSLILTSNLHPGRIDTIFPKGLATAAVDRLLHHAHVVITEGRSKSTEGLATSEASVIGSLQSAPLICSPAAEASRLARIHR